LEAELNLDPDSNPDPNPESDPELITDPDPNLQIIPDPAGSGSRCTTLLPSTSYHNYPTLAVFEAPPNGISDAPVPQVKRGTVLQFGSLEEVFLNRLLKKKSKYPVRYYSNK
jgi:hypothetical protein